MSDIRSAYTDDLRFYGDTTPRELADRFGTPLYVYNERILRARCRDQRQPLLAPDHPR